MYSCLNSIFIIYLMNQVQNIIIRKDFTRNQCKQKLVDLINQLKYKQQNIVHRINTVTQKFQNIHQTKIYPQFINLQFNQKKLKIKQYLSNSQDTVQEKIISEKTEVKVMRMVKDFIVLYQKITKVKNISNIFDMLKQLEEIWYSIKSDLKNDQIIINLNSKINILRTSLDQKLYNLIKKDSNTIIVNFYELERSVSKIKNKQIIQKFFIDTFNDLIQYIGSTCLINIKQIQVQYKEKFISYNLTLRQLNPRTQHEAKQFIDCLRKNLKIIGQFQQSIKKNIQNEQMRNEIVNYQNEFLKNIVDQIFPVLYIFAHEDKIELSQLLNIKEGIFDNNIIDLLLQFKYSSTKTNKIELIAKKITQNLKQFEQQKMDNVLFYLKMSLKTQRIDTLNLTMYLCNYIIEELEDQIQYKWIIQLLGIREEIRKKIFSKFN